MFVQKVPSAQYAAKMDKIKKEYAGMGLEPLVECVPVDLNGAIVSLSKKEPRYASIEKDIQERFGLTKGGV